MPNNVSLWGEEFNSDINLENNIKKSKKILNKINNPIETTIINQKILKSNKISLQEKLSLIEEEVERVLGHYRSNTLVIHNRDELYNYISQSIKNNIIAIDTETNNSLDPLTCLLMGGCIYTPGEKNCYIPVHHRNSVTGEKIDWQLTEQDIKEEFQRLIDNNVKIIMHNAKFDYQVIKCTCGLILPIYWDTMVACKLINENEKSAGLKQQYIDKIDKEQEKYDIEHLFSGVEYADVDPDIFALYAATDAYMTYKLYEYQKPIMESNDFKKINNLFHNIEMPCVEVVAEMELNGVEFDTEYCERLNKKYTDKLNNIVKEINEELFKLKPQIDTWRLTKEANEKAVNIKKINNIEYGYTGNEYTGGPGSMPYWYEVKTGRQLSSTEVDSLGLLANPGKSKNEQLDDPINLSSPVQLSILLYDILKAPVIDKKSPRGTGSDILKQLDFPICKLLIEYKEIEKLLNAFIYSLPEKVNNFDGRIHCHFNQFGADTGRFSSNDPNLQNIPAHNKEIRMLFKAKNNYTLIGSDYSQQEPRLLSCYSQDENMINAYKQDKDLYATIASGVYHNDYWDNMEFHQDGTPNPEGKKRRKNCKSILLGIMYGRGVSSIAEQINSSIEEAQQIIDNFFKSFPKVKIWIDKTINDAKKNGYVEDLWGRRRRLPNLLLHPYEITYEGKVEPTFNPFLNCKDKVDNKIENQMKNYEKQLLECKYKKEVTAIKDIANKNGFKVKENSILLSQAERQCVNARIQGGSATMTKIAMNKLYRDKELNDLGFKLLIGVHDELIGECPKENVDKVEKRFTYVMKTAIQDVCEVPFKCDADICEHWYYNDYCNELKEHFNADLEENNNKEELFNKYVKEHSEISKEQLKYILL